MRLLFIIAATLLFFSACEDPGTIGSGLLGNEELQITFTDSIYVKGRTVPGDSVGIVSTNMSIGVLDDPIFGNTTNRVFLGAELSLVRPDFEFGVLDSVILRILLKEGNSYGDTMAVHHTEVYQLEQEMFEFLTELETGLDSSTEVPYSNKLGDTMFVANYVDSIYVNRHILDTIIGLAPHLRVRLDRTIGEQFMGLTSDELTDSLFRHTLNGFLIQSTPSLDNMLALDFDQQTGGGFLDFYYHNSGTSGDTAKIYTAEVGRARFLNVQHNVEGSGSELEAALNDISDDQEFLYMEPYAGVNIEFDLSELKNYQDKVLNNVILEMSLAEVMGFDYDTYPPIENVTLNYRNEDGELRLISDISTVGVVLDDIETYFGGKLIEKDGVMKYSMNITNHAIQLLNGEFDDNYKVILRSYFKSRFPKRSIVQGNNGDNQGPILKLVITEP